MTDQNKVWKTVATLNNYDSAVVLKAKLVEEYTLVKIKRGYPDIYRIKVWDPPVEKSTSKETSATLKKGKFKKGQNNRRKEKNVQNNKKVHSGPQG